MDQKTEILGLSYLRRRGNIYASGVSDLPGKRGKMNRVGAEIAPKIMSEIGTRFELKRAKILNMKVLCAYNKVLGVGLGGESESLRDNVGKLGIRPYNMVQFGGSVILVNPVRYSCNISHH